MLSISSPAKLNLFLEVTGKRADGYHDIESVFLELKLADVLTASPAPKGVVRLHCTDETVPSGDDNLIVRAAKLLAAECGVEDGIDFTLMKYIPMGGGLGGGSSNAAAALRLANRLWKQDLSNNELAELGARLGSDVPFFLYGGVCLCRGRGEIISPLPPLPRTTQIGLALTAIHSDTTTAYRGLKLPKGGGRRPAEAFIKAMATGDAGAMAAAAFNRFEETVYQNIPELDAMRLGLSHHLSNGPRLSGSGSGLWFFGNSAKVRRSISADAELIQLGKTHQLRLLDG